MNKERLEEVKEKLGPEFSCVLSDDGQIIINVDPWRNVEFAEITAESNGLFVTKGKIYKIYDLSISWIIIENDQGESGGIVHKSSAKPSTESAYVEQLKAKAKELYGEIKDGDKFDLFQITGNKGSVSISLRSSPTFSYYKANDMLALNGFTLFKKGKWVKKIETKRKAEVIHLSQRRDRLDSFLVSIEILVPIDIVEKINSRNAYKNLKKHIETYFNK